MTDDLPKTLIDAIVYYRDPKTCFETMLAVKWPDGKITCPKAQAKSKKRAKKRKK